MYPYHGPCAQRKVGPWFIELLENAAAYRPSFKLPEALATWIFESENRSRAAVTAKEHFFSNIYIYHHSETADSLIRLRYRPEMISSKPPALDRDL